MALGTHTCFSHRVGIASRTRIAGNPRICALKRFAGFRKSCKRSDWSGLRPISWHIATNPATGTWRPYQASRISVA
jgi:hypothetical protein